MSFLSAEDVIAELDNDEPAEGSEEADLSFQGVADEEQSNIDAREDESEQPDTDANEDSLGETEQAQTASEGEPNQEGQSSAREGPSVYESSEESSQEVSSEDEETQRKKPTRKRKKRPDTWQKHKRKRRRNSGKKYVSISKKVVSGKLLRYSGTGLCNTHGQSPYEPCCTSIPLGPTKASNSDILWL